MNIGTAMCCSTIHNNRFGNKPCPSTDEHISKMQGTSVYTEEHYSAMRKKEILSYVTTWLDLEDLMLSEITHKKKYFISLICTI